MIVLDIEASGLDVGKCGICQIGAVDLNDTTNMFLEEARIDEEDIITKEALQIIGKTEEELREKNKQSQRELLENFYDWIEKIEEKIFLEMNGWDNTFISSKSIKYGLEERFIQLMRQKIIDLHTIVALKYKEFNGAFKLNKKNQSFFGFKQISEYCGVPFKFSVDKNKGFQDGEPHNPLEEAKLTAECYYRLVEGKNFFPEFAKYPISEELKK